jgi:single-stranded-DNA-specific exonuclease
LNALQADAFVGVQALMEVGKLAGKPSLSSEDIAFTIGPRLNAAGRLGQAEMAVELLITESPDRARQLAEYIAELNSQRDGLEKSILLAAQKQIKQECDLEKDAALVLAGRGWHVGVIGIVAGRIAEKYARPTLVIALDELGKSVATGSGRTAAGVNLYEALRECSDHLVGFGGHAAAAGLRVDEAHLEQFRDRFCSHVAQLIRPEDRVAEIWIDAETTLGQLTLPTVTQMEQLAPFGHANPRPILCTTGVRLAEPPRRMGEGDRHLSVRLVQHERAIRAVAFGQGEWADPLAAHTGTFDIAFRPVINEFMGRKNVELHLVDWRPTA